MRMSLPSLDPGRKLPSLLGSYAVFSVLYLLSGRLHVRQPRSLPLSAFDRAVPFLPWTLFLYLTQFLFLPVALGLLRDTANLNRVFRGMVLASLVSFAIFAAFPVVYPRPAAEGDLAFRLLYAVDSPANCLPSLHVSLAFLAAMGFRDERRECLAAAMGWAGLLALSTLFVKQHYAVDVAGGLLLALVCHALVRCPLARTAGLGGEHRSSERYPLAAQGEP